MPKSVRFYLSPVAAFIVFAITGTLLQPTLLYSQGGCTPPTYWLGRSVAGVGDVNGDGIPDFVVGAPFANPEGLTEAGSAYLYSGADGSLLFQKNGSAVVDHFGSSAAGAGDVNGDGRADFIIGALLADPGGFINAGSAFVYSGADGSLLFRKNGAEDHDNLGVSVAGAGDVNEDGNADFIIGAYTAKPSGLMWAGSAFVYSGATGALLYQKDGAAQTYYLGESVAGAGDVNGDGKADFIVGAEGASPGGLSFAGSAYVYSGVTGSLLYQKDGAAQYDLLGWSAAGAGDVNGDGKADFIVGAPFADPSGLDAAGSAYIYSGADGSLLYQKNGAAARGFFGTSVATAGDVNGDGRPDFIIGANRADPSGVADTGSAYVYSGADGSLLYRKNGAEFDDNLGISVGGAGDVNGDGKADFIVGAIFAGTLCGATDIGSAFVYSGSDGSLLYTINGDPFAKGDTYSDRILNSSDVVCMLNCVFLGSGSCDLCLADVNCDGMLTASDVVLEVNRVFLGLTAPPWCGS